jgi:hypothetical protein
MWKVIYYESADGRCPIMDFIESRKKENQAKVLALIKLLQEKGPNLPRPYADLLEDGIHELRIKLSGDQIRFLYFFASEILLSSQMLLTKPQTRFLNPR